METQFVTINKVKFDTLPVELGKSTLYRWNKNNIHPELFKRIGGRILVDINKLNSLLENGEVND